MRSVIELLLYRGQLWHSSPELPGPSKLYQECRVCHLTHVHYRRHRCMRCVHTSFSSTTCVCCMCPGLVRTHGECKFFVILQDSSWTRPLDFGPIVQWSVGLARAEHEV